MDGDTLDTPADLTTPVHRADSLSASRGRALVPAEVRDALKRGGSQVGKFIAVKELGQGGMGIVYQAWDPDLGRWVALKMIKGAGDAQEVARFLREAQTSARLVHPNIAQVYEASEQPFPYLAIQFIDGVGANSYDVRKLPLQRAAEIVRDAAIGLDFAHSKGVIHRDVKPHNIMVGKDGQVYVLDFGLAKSLGGDQSLSVSGALVGTPNFMSPEQAQAKRDLGRATDVYSLGATLYWLATGKAPSQGRSLQETLHNVVTADPPKPSAHNARIPADLDAVILKAMDKDPKRRYPTARALADDLQRFLLGEPVSAHVPSLGVRLARWTRKNKGLAAGLAGVAALAVALVAVLVISAKRDTLRVEELRRTELEAEASKRKAQDALADIEAIGRRIVEWQAVLHDPPRPMAAEDRRLEAMITELDRASAPDLLCRASVLAHKGNAYILLDRPEEAVRHLEEALALFRDFAAQTKDPYREEARHALVLGTEHLRNAQQHLLRFAQLTDADQTQRRVWSNKADQALDKARERLAFAAKSATGEEAEYARVQLALAEAGTDRARLEDVSKRAISLASARPDARWFDLAATAAARLGRDGEAASHAVKAARILESSSYHVRRAGELVMGAIGDVNVPGAAKPELFEDAERWMHQALRLRPDDSQVALRLAELADKYYWYLVRGSADQPQEAFAKCRRMLKENGDLCAKHVDRLLDLGFGSYLYRMANNSVHLGMLQLSAGEDPTKALDDSIAFMARFQKLPSQKDAEDSESAWAYAWKIKYLRSRKAGTAESILAAARGAESTAGPNRRGPTAAHAIGSCWWEAAQALAELRLDATEAVQKTEEWAGLAISLRETYVDAWILRGQVRLGVGNRQGACQDFSKALELAPGRQDLKQIVDSLR